MSFISFSSVEALYYFRSQWFSAKLKFGILAGIQVYPADLIFQPMKKVHCSSCLNSAEIVFMAYKELH